jgi:hypothetical protein
MWFSFAFYTNVREPLSHSVAAAVAREAQTISDTAASTTFTASSSSSVSPPPHLYYLQLPKLTCVMAVLLFC